MDLRATMTVSFLTRHINYIAQGLHVGRFSYERKQIWMDCALTYLRQARHSCQQNLKTLTLYRQPSRLLSVQLWTNMCQHPSNSSLGQNKPAKIDVKKTACTSKRKTLQTSSGLGTLQETTSRGSTVHKEGSQRLHGGGSQSGPKGKLETLLVICQE